MVIARISTKLILTIAYLFICGFCKAQTNVGDKILQNLYNSAEDTTTSYLNSDAVFIIITPKNCIGCLQAACKYFKNKKKVIAIDVMTKNYLLSSSEVVKFKNELDCLSDVLFYFIDKNTTPDILSLYNAPSPQLIMKRDNKYTYIDYPSTQNLVDPSE